MAGAAIQETDPILTIQSAAPASTTAILAGQVPLEPSASTAAPEVPEIIKESQEEAHVAPEASANPEAVEEKKELEDELKARIPEEPATSEGGLSASKITGSVTEGIAAAGADVTQIPAEQIDSTFSGTIDLLSKPLGSRILSFSDEWFASASNLTTPTPPVRKPGVFVFSGAWYDGWETRRHNTAEYDYVVLRLGVASGKVKGVEIDTAYFDGNHAPAIAVEGTFSADEDEEKLKTGFEGWETILSKRECGPSQRHGWLLPQITEKAYTHIRLLMYPDGGIARFRLYGVALPVFPQDVNQIFDLAATVNGGVAISCSDQHFGTKDNLLLPGRGVDMGDGWETKRTRGEHVDWTIVKLGTRGHIDKIVIDTAHFRGNFPQKVQVFALDKESEELPKADDAGWVEVLSPQKAGPDIEHNFEGEQLVNVKDKAFGYAKLVIIPDGGVKRFRVFGRRAV